MDLGFRQLEIKQISKDRAKPPCQDQTITHFLAGLLKNITNIDTNIDTNNGTKLYSISNTFSWKPVKEYHKY